MLGPLPSSLATPSIWYKTVLAPNRKFTLAAGAVGMHWRRSPATVIIVLATIAFSLHSVLDRSSITIRTCCCQP
ncbi:hypothetical protein QEZ54_20885 [Catellatospora sp. KI3]|uniref:hypothetical protein n=1 Tax=Catellatospora sp. KI3 TaxID=3041620 RepID=UPI002482F25D|nr:hypothetical protein [Catellatospora sp. KI3]MDI1463441.1 hypothetical protein [Catellatospora sp. KI3]